jgi:hypothetical protein
MAMLARRPFPSRSRRRSPAHRTTATHNIVVTEPEQTASAASSFLAGDA